MALVTIGIPVYNEEMFLEQTIKSALSQKFEDIEIVISDNASTDKSAAIINKYAQIDRRIKPFYNETNLGPVANYLSLLEHTNTKYFVLLGAHDIFLPDYISEAVAFLESNPGYVLVYPHSKLVDGNDVQLGYSDSDIDTNGLNTRQRMKNTLRKLYWCTCVYGVFRTDIVKKIPSLQIRGGDNLMLFATSYYGHIHFMDSLGILRREWHDETPEMTLARRIKAGMYDEPESKLYNSMSVMATEHIRFVIEKTRLSLFNKAYLIMFIMLLFKHRFKTRFSSLVFAYLKR